VPNETRRRSSTLTVKVKSFESRRRCRPARRRVVPGHDAMAVDEWHADFMGAAETAVLVMLWVGASIAVAQEPVVATTSGYGALPCPWRAPS